MHALRKLLERLDRVIYRVEVVLLIASLASMTTLVFSDVVQRTFTRQVGKTAQILISVLGIEGDEAQQAVADLWGPVVFYTVLGLLCVAGAHSARGIAAEREGKDRPAFGRSLIVGIGAFIAIVVYVQAVARLFPTGISGAGKLANGFMVWSGMLGASLATRSKRHIALESLKRKLDQKTLALFSFIGALITSGFCALMAYLSFRKTYEQLHAWMLDSNMETLDAIAFPVWPITLALPFTFFMIGSRFLASGVSDLLWGTSLAPPEDTFGLNTDDEEEEEDHGPLPDLVYGTEHPSGGRSEA